MRKQKTKAMAIAIASIFIIGIGTLGYGGKAAASSSEKITGKRILWEHAGDLEAQFGQDKNIGTAGLLVGESGGYIIAGGGANFPDDPVAVGGAKKHYPDIYVLKQENGRLKQVKHTKLKYEIGYGSSITDDDGVYYIGGSPDAKEGNNVTLFSVDEKGKLKEKLIGDLPFTISDGIAVKHGNYIYVGLGKQDSKASNKMYKFDLKTKKTQEIASMPGEATRNQAVAQVLNDEIYVFSGGDKVAYTDGYKYNMKKNKWEKVSDVKVDGKKISLLGASSVKLNNEEMLVVGGFDKTVYDYAVEKLGTLQGDELADFKKKYFGADPSELRWNKKILIYNAKSNSWKSIGEIPFDAPCGAGVVLDGEKIYSINGEIKPGTRTNRTYVGTILNK